MIHDSRAGKPRASGFGRELSALQAKLTDGATGAGQLPELEALFLPYTRTIDHGGVEHAPASGRPAPPAAATVQRATFGVPSNSGFDREYDDQRDDDKRRGRRPFEDKPGGVPAWNLRPLATMVIAFSTATGRYYVGYSGPSGGITPDRAVGRTEQNDRRYDRVFDFIEGTEQRNTRHTVENCAEPSALSIAIAHGERPRDLVFAAFSPTGGRMDPCQNCIQWMRDTVRGYINSRGEYIQF